MSFEGSYLGANERISEQAIMECKICWTPYEPAEGDDTRQVEPGTPFSALPEDWSCPNCSAPKEQFMVLEDPGAADLLEANRIAAVTGHSHESCTQILKHYLAQHPEMASSAIAKMIAWYDADGETEIGL